MGNVRNYLKLVNDDAVSGSSDVCIEEVLADIEAEYTGLRKFQ